MNIADVVRALAGFVWLIFVGLLVLLWRCQSQASRSGSFGIIAGVALVVALLLSILGTGLVFYGKSICSGEIGVSAQRLSSTAAGTRFALDRPVCRERAK